MNECGSTHDTVRERLTESGFLCLLATQIISMRQHTSHTGWERVLEPVYCSARVNQTHTCTHSSSVRPHHAPKAQPLLPCPSLTHTHTLHIFSCCLRRTFDELIQLLVLVGEGDTHTHIHTHPLLRSHKAHCVTTALLCPAHTLRFFSCCLRRTFANSSSFWCL